MATSTQDLVLRPVEYGDAAELLEVERAIVAAGHGVVQGLEDLPATIEDSERALQPWIDGEFSGSRGHLVVAESDGHLVASGEIRRLGAARVNHVAHLSLGVAPTAEGAGIGRAVLEYLIAWAKDGPGNGVHRIELAVNVDNLHALGLYLSLGFVVEGRRREFVENSDGLFVDDYLMSLLI